jgi:hypothetical protein
MTDQEKKEFDFIARRAVMLIIVLGIFLVILNIVL